MLLGGLEVVIPQDSENGNPAVGMQIFREDVCLFREAVIGEIAAEEEDICSMRGLGEKLGALALGTARIVDVAGGGNAERRGFWHHRLHRVREGGAACRSRRGTRVGRWRAEPLAPHIIMVFPDS